MAELAEHANRFKDKDADLVVIGSGAPKNFNAFREITGYKGLLFSDPSLKVFSALHFSNSISGFMSMGSMFKAVSALAGGHRQGSVQGSTMQLGGAVVINPAGSVLYYFPGKKAGDHPPVDDLIRVVDNKT